MTIYNLIKNHLSSIITDEISLDKASRGIEARLRFLDKELLDDSSLFDFAEKIGHIVRHFDGSGLGRDDFLAAAIRQPSLFCQRPATVIGNIEAVADHFGPEGLTRDTYLAAAIRQPSLFCQRPATVIGNIEAVADHFASEGLTLGEYLAVAVKHPPLFYQRPATVIGNIEAVADHFGPEGLTRGAYLRAALRQPSLFSQNAGTIIAHVNLLSGLAEAGLLGLPDSTRGPPLSPIEFPLKLMIGAPKLFSLSDDNFALREIYARVTGSRLSCGIVKKSRTEIERELTDALGGRDPGRTIPKIGPDEGIGPHARNLLLRALVREGWVRGRLD